MTQINLYNPSIYVVGPMPYLLVKRTESNRREAPKVTSIEEPNNETPQDHYQRQQQRGNGRRLLDLLA